MHSFFHEILVAGTVVVYFWRVSAADTLTTLEHELARIADADIFGVVSWTNVMIFADASIGRGGLILLA